MTLITMSSALSMMLPPLVYLLSTMTSMKSVMSNREKLSPFECGFDPIRSARIPFSMRFFLLAVIFIVFDIEIVLLVPIPLLMKTPSPLFTLNTTIFLLILVVGLLYEWLEGSLNWTS